jgi:hypothetical protein
MIIYTKRIMIKYITVLLLAVFLIPFVQNVDAQSVLGPTSGGLGGGIKNIPSGGGQTANNTADQAGQSVGQAGQAAQNTTGQAGQSMNNTSQQAGQAAQNTTGQAGQSVSNATSQNNNTSGGNPIMDMLGKIIPGQ